MTLEIEMINFTGRFAENKDVARKIRTEQIIPALDKGEDVILNFISVDSTTQSFIHALISDVIRKRGIASLDHLLFKNCNEIVKKLIGIVVDYMQDNMTMPSLDKRK